MYKAQFELEAITPIFMRGADQSQAEIRASSIKGLMRWWFRALVGSYFGDDVEGLRKAEEYVFGSTKRRSKVVVEVKSPKPRKFDYDIKDIKFDFRKRRLRPVVYPKIREVNNQDQQVGLPSYLFFSVKMLIDELAKTTLENVLAERGIRNEFKDEKQMRKILSKKGLSYPDDVNRVFREKFDENVLEYYPHGENFEICVGSYDILAFKLAIASLWFLSNYGGIGFRSRRGAGSILVTEIKKVQPQEFKKEIEELFGYTWKELTNASKFWQDSIQEIYKIYGSKKENQLLYPTIESIIVLEKDGYENHLEALEDLEKAYAGVLNKSRYRYENGVRFVFADRKGFSHKIIGNFKNLNNVTDVETSERRFYFGLPLIYANWSVQVLGYNVKNPREPYTRRASSVILTVKKREERYIPLVVIVPYQFLPKHDGRLVLSKGKIGKKTIRILKEKDSQPPDNKWFIQWLERDVVREFENRGFVKVYPMGGE